MTTVKPESLTADDLLRLHGKGVKGELVRGALHETMASGLRQPGFTCPVRENL